MGLEILLHLFSQVCKSQGLIILFVSLYLHALEYVRDAFSDTQWGFEFEE